METIDKQMEVEEQKLFRGILYLNSKIIGLVLGLTCGLIIFIATNWLVFIYAVQQGEVLQSSLGYFIAPLDAIVDLTPVVGYADDLGVLALALAAVATYVNDNVREKTAVKMKDWFGE